VRRRIEYVKTNACHFLRAWQPDERATEQRMDQSMGGYRQRHSEAEVDYLHLGTLVPVCDIRDGAGATAHGS
jgi:hypothetical protein